MKTEGPIKVETIQYDYFKEFLIFIVYIWGISVKSRYYNVIVAV
jgi:hypothetical protein